MRHSNAAALALTVCVLSACTTTTRHAPADPHALTETTATGALAGRPTFTLPISIPGHNTCLIPFSLEDRKGWFDRADPFSRGGYADRGVVAAASVAQYSPSWGGSIRWHNAIIHDLTTNEEWPILDRRGVIGRWAAFAPPSPPNNPAAPPVCTALVFLTTTEDTNRDGLLNDLDANQAIVTQGDGRSPRTVSPPNAQVWSISFDAAHNRLYLLVIADTNGDGKFNDNDAPVPHVLNLADPGPARPLLAEPTTRRVESLLK